MNRRHAIQQKYISKYLHSYIFVFSGSRDTKNLLLRWRVNRKQLAFLVEKRYSLVSAQCVSNNAASSPFCVIVHIAYWHFMWKSSKLVERAIFFSVSLSLSQIIISHFIDTQTQFFSTLNQKNRKLNMTCKHIHEHVRITKCILGWVQFLEIKKQPRFS